MIPTKHDLSTKRTLAERARKVWLPAAALFVLSAIVYAPTLRNGYVSDDSGYVVSNFALRSLEGLYNIWFTIGTVQQYYPLVFTMFWGEYQLWGLHPAGYHVVNLFLHALAAIMLWRVLVRLELPGAWLGAAIFAVHPVQVESVAWISERKNVLSCVLALAAMLSYWRFAPPEAQVESKRRIPNEPSAWRFYALAMLLFIGALLSKSVTASMPAVLLVIVWWKRGRLTWADVAPLVPFFAVGISVGLLTVWMEKVYVGASGDHFNFSPVDRILIAGRAVWFYAGKLAWPYPLMFFYPRWKIDPSVWWQYLYPLFAVLLLVVLWLARKRIGRGPLAAALIFGGVLVPAIGFFDVFPFRFSFVADHYQYHASIALIALAAAGLTTAVRNFGRNATWAMPVAAAVILIPLTALAHQKTYVYWDDFTLHEDVAKLNPDPWVAYNNLAGIYMKEKDYEKAREALHKTIELVPKDPVPHANLGAVLTEMGRYDEALAELERAMKLNAGDQDERAWIQRLVADVQLKQNRLDEALVNYNESIAKRREWSAVMQRGRVRAMRGDRAGALSDLDLAAQLQPDSTEVLELRSKLFTSLGQFDKALADLKTLQARLPNNAEVMLQMGGVQQAAQAWPLAIEAYSQAIALDPNNAAAYLGRGDCYLTTGRPALAVSDYRKSLVHDAGNVNALNNLAWILATSPDDQLRDGTQAVEYARKACDSTDFRRADFLSTLAAAHAEAGDFVAAIDWLKRALPLAGQPLEAQLQEQLHAYESKQAWREPKSS